MAHLTLVSSVDQLPQNLDVGALVAPYRPYSLAWLIRLRRGEVDMSRPARLSAPAPVAGGQLS